MCYGYTKTSVTPELIINMHLVFLSVVKCTVLLQEINNFAAVNEVYAKRK